MSRITVTISLSTRQKLFRFARARGLSASAVVEKSLLAFIEGFERMRVPSQIVLSAKAFDRLTRLLRNPPKPTRALRELMRGP